MGDLPTNAPEGSTYTDKSGQSYVRQGGMWRFSDGVYVKSGGGGGGSSSSSASKKTPTPSDVADANRALGGQEIFVVDAQGRLQVNPNLPEAGQQTAKQIAERRGWTIGEQIAQPPSAAVLTSIYGVQLAEKLGAGQGGSGSATTSSTQTALANAPTQQSGPAGSQQQPAPQSGKYNYVPPQFDESTSLARQGGVGTWGKNEPVYTSDLVPLTYQETREQTLAGQQEYYNRQREIWGSLPVIGEANIFGVDISDAAAGLTTQLYVGTKETLAGVEQVLTGRTQFYQDTFIGERRADDLISTGLARTTGAGATAFGAGFVGGTAVFAPYAMATGATSLTATNFVLTAAKSGASFYAFDVGLSTAVGGVSGFAEGGLSGAVKGVGKGLTETLTLERAGRDMFLGVALLPAGAEIGKFATGLGQGVITTNVLAGGMSGFVYGSTIAVAEGKGNKAGEYAFTGVALGATIGGIAGYAETKGYKPEIGMMETARVEKGQVITEYRGVKFGYGKINTQTGAYEFHGLQYSWNKGFTEGGVYIPKGIAELSTYQPFKSKAAVEEAQGLFREYYGNIINKGLIRENLRATAGEYTDDIIKNVNKEGGHFGGSSVERGIGKLSDTSVRYADTKPGDIDLQFTGIDAWKAFSKTLPSGSKITQKDLPIKFGGSEFIQKYEVVLPNSGRIDVSVVESSVWMPKPNTPLAGFTGISTYSHSDNLNTYSVQQQVATKGMAVGTTASGQIKPIEPGKEKYVADVAAFGSQTRAETEQKISNWGYVYEGGGKLSPKSQIVGYGSMSVSIQPSMLFPELRSAVQREGVKASGSAPVSIQPSLIYQKGGSTQSFTERWPSGSTSQFSNSISGSNSMPSLPSFPSLSSFPSKSQSSGSQSGGSSISYKSSDSHPPSPPSPPSPKSSGSSSSSSFSVDVNIGGPNVNFSRMMPPPVLPFGRGGFFSDRGWGFGRKGARGENLRSLLPVVRAGPLMPAKIFGGGGVAKKKKKK